MMRYLVVCAVVAVITSGCGGSRKSSLLLERYARGPLEEALTVAQSVHWTVTPVMDTKTQDDVTITVNYASLEFLRNFFTNKKVFGPYAGRNPYPPEYFVFYVNIANRSSKKILVNPAEFGLVDDRGNQLGTLGTDYVTALSESRKPFSTATRGVIEEARPGYFGVSFPIGKFVAQKSQTQFALLKQSSLQAGYLYPGVVHDGLIAFWSPSTLAKKLRLLITSIKTNFDANEWPKESLDFIFEFDVAPR
jgi:hypothetical protein